MSHPDADLHPVATGFAKTTVDAHQGAAPLKLYAGWFCPFVQRVWAVLEAKNIPYQYEEVNPYHKPASLMTLNPRGLVPTVEYQNKPLYESNVILEFLEEAYPHCSPSLLPADLYDRARMRIWQDWFTTRFLPAFHRFLQYQPSSATGGGDDGLQKVRDEFLGKCKELVAEMDPVGPFFLGAEPMMIDFVAAPWVLRMWVFDHFKGGSGVPEEGNTGDEEALWSRWRKWANAVESMKGIRETTSEREYFLPIYKRYADDKVGAAFESLLWRMTLTRNQQAQSEMAKSIRAGRGVP